MSFQPDKDQAGNSRQTESGHYLADMLKRAVWGRPIAAALVITGFILVLPFAKPYLELAFMPTPLESGHRNPVDGGRIFIPGIKLSAPLFEDARRLDDGVVHEPGTSFPGEAGNTVLSGHNRASTKGPLFALLYLARVDDEVVLHYQGKRYAYTIKERRIVEPRMLPKYTRQSRDKRLTLTTCYPPTRTFMRLILIAKPKGAPGAKK